MPTEGDEYAEETADEEINSSSTANSMDFSRETNGASENKARDSIIAQSTEGRQGSDEPDNAALNPELLYFERFALA